MKYASEYRDPAAIRACALDIARTMTRPWTLMEVCGGQTHAIVRYGLDELLPDGLTLIHGPGCPVCVTPVGILDLAHRIAARPEVIFCTFADMLRVPGSTSDLFAVKAGGGDVRTIFSPLDAVRIAAQEPAREVVLFAVGFETTAPANAMAVYQAAAQKLENFSVLVSHVLVPPAMAAILTAADNRVQAFLAAGHVCAVMGTAEYEPLVRDYGVPVVVTGFEPLDIMQGIAQCVRQLEGGRAELENQYTRAVRTAGNAAARSMIAEVFSVRDRDWRGIGGIARSGLGLSTRYAHLDAEARYGRAESSCADDGECISGTILRGLAKPPDCPAFGTRCTPTRPLGATMVSGEGACAAYYRYRGSLPA